MNNLYVTYAFANFGNDYVRYATGVWTTPQDGDCEAIPFDGDAIRVMDNQPRIYVAFDGFRLTKAFASKEQTYGHDNICRVIVNRISA